MRVVIDTNCLIASIPPRSSAYWLYQAFQQQCFEWLISNEILLEYEEQIAAYYSPKTAEIILKILSIAPNVIYKEAFINWNLIEQDPDDNKFVDLAISVNAHFLVSNDRHFDVLKTVDFPTVKVVSLEEFRQILQF